MSLVRDSARKITLCVVMVFSFLFLQVISDIALAREFVHTVQFTPGKHSATVSGSVVRGDVQKYLFRARAGQWMTVKVNAVEDNAAFQIYPPGKEGFLPGAGEEDDAKSWAGKLPSSGRYTIVVGGIRGNATYTLKVAIESEPKK